MAAKTNAYTVPGMTKAQGTKVAGILQDRLNALNDLALTLKHVHWNVIGPHFIAVHEMIDPQVDAVRAMVDETAERIATLDVVYTGVIEAHRQAMDDTEDPDPVTQDMLIGQLGQLELFHWFVRGHLETAGGEIPTTAARTEKGAAKKAAARARRGTR